MTGNKHVLVTSANGDIGRSIIEICRQAGYSVFTCDMNPNLLDSDCLTVPAARDTDEYLETVNRLIGEYSIDLLIPVSEAEIEVISDNRDFLEKSGLRIAINHTGIVNVFLDKFYTANWFRDNGIPFPRTCLMEDAPGRIGFPVIVKPRNSCGSKGIRILKNSEELDFYRKNSNQNVVVQQYLPADDEEYTTGIFSDGKKVYSISFRRILGYGGLTKQADLVDDPVLESLAEDIALKCGLVGSINLQCRKQSGQYYPFEINPRLSSTTIVRKHFGFDDCIWWLEMLQGKAIHYEKQYREGTVVRTFQEHYVNMHRVKGSEND